MEGIDARGILYPARLPSFHRHPAVPPLDASVRWFWIPRWRLAPGRASRQELLPFPASNLVVEPDAVMVVGPGTRSSHRDLTGEGWAVGALLRPAGVAGLIPRPGDLRDAQAPFEAQDLHDAVRSAMGGRDEDAGRANAVEAFTAWLVARLAAPEEGALLANAMEDLIATERSLVHVDQVAARLHISVRTLQRLAERYVGVPPLAIIRRYRLQEAAQRLRQDPGVRVADVAAELGYADQSHLTDDFTRILGITPRGYRRTQPNP